MNLSDPPSFITPIILSIKAYGIRPLHKECSPTFGPNLR